MSHQSEAKVELSINATDLAYYNESTQDWEVEQGTYKLHVGTASNKISKILSVSIK